MAVTRTMAWGMAGSAVTVAARTAARRALHNRGGGLGLPRATRNSRSLGMMLALAAATGVLLAVVDVLQEGRRRAIRE